jgi:hypothetical protein
MQPFSGSGLAMLPMWKTRDGAFMEPSRTYARVSATTGMTRDVFCWYSAKA